MIIVIVVIVVIIILIVVVVVDEPIRHGRHAAGSEVALILLHDVRRTYPDLYTYNLHSTSILHVYI